MNAFPCTVHHQHCISYHCIDNFANVDEIDTDLDETANNRKEVGKLRRIAQRMLSATCSRDHILYISIRLGGGKRRLSKRGL